MNKKLSVVIAVVAAAVLLGAVVFKTRPAQSSKEFAIGAILPMTGTASGYGQWMQRGIEIAVEDVNAAGGVNGRPLRVIIEDSKSDNRVGVDAATKLVSLDHVPAMITVLTGVTKSIIPITERSRVIHFTLAMSPGLTEDGTFVFRNATSVANEADRMVKACSQELNIEKLAIIYINNPAGLWVADYLKQQMVSGGPRIVAAESFQPEMTDFRTQLTKIKQELPEALYILGYSQNGLIMKQARELGLACKFIGAADCELPDVLKIAGDAAEGTIYTKAAFDLNTADKQVEGFVSKYLKRYGEQPEVFGATTYDAVRIMALAFASAGQDADKMRTFILALKDYPGVSGRTTFLQNGDVSKPVEIKQIQGGKYVPFSE